MGIQETLGEQLAPHIKKKTALLNQGMKIKIEQSEIFVIQ